MSRALAPLRTRSQFQWSFEIPAEMIYSSGRQKTICPGLEKGTRLRMKILRILILSDASSAALDQLLRRLQKDLPTVDIAAIVRTESAPPSGLRHWLRRAANHLVQTVGAGVQNAFHFVLRFFHAVPRGVVGARSSAESVRDFCEKNAIPVCSRLVVDPADWPGALPDVRADLIVVHGPQASRPQLIARLGGPSISVSSNIVIDNPSAGKEARARLLAQVYRMAPRGPGRVLAQRSFSLEPYDGAEGIELKARLLELDCLVEVLQAESNGGPVGETGAVFDFDTTRPYTDEGVSQRTSVPRQRFWPAYTRPWYKLAVRMLAYPAIRWRNRTYARDQCFPIIILFHHVVTDRPKRLGMPTEQFLRQVRFLKRHYKIASLPEAIEMLRRGKVPVPTVVLTFDDGYEDNFLCLRAVAEAEEVPVTLFVCTQKLTERAPFDHDVARGELGFPALSWEALRYLERHHVTIGSHTRTHLDCASTDDETLQSEIVGSREDLHRELGHDVPYFSFPKGKLSNMSLPARTIASRTYPYVFSARGGVNHVPWVPGSTLKRCSHPDSIVELELLSQSLLNFSEDRF